MVLYGRIVPKLQLLHIWHTFRPGGGGGCDAVRPCGDGGAVRPCGDGGAVRPCGDGGAVRPCGDGGAVRPSGDGAAVRPCSDGGPVRPCSDGGAVRPCGSGSAVQTCRGGGAGQTGHGGGHSAGGDGIKTGDDDGESSDGCSGRVGRKEDLNCQRSSDGEVEEEEVQYGWSIAQRDTGHLVWKNLCIGGEGEGEVLPYLSGNGDNGGSGGGTLSGRRSIVCRVRVSRLKH